MILHGAVGGLQREDLDLAAAQGDVAVQAGDTVEGVIEAIAAPPYGATKIEPAALTKWIETNPSAAAISAQSPMRPMWPELRKATAASPLALHFSMPSFTACGPTVWP